MHRTQIYLHDELYEQLRSRSRAQGVSISELIRRAVEKDLEAQPEDAACFFERLVPLESFADIEPESYVRSLHRQSRMLWRGRHDEG